MDNAEKQKRFYDRRQKLRLCPKCKTPLLDNHAYCDTCRAKRAAAKRRRDAKGRKQNKKARLKQSAQKSQIEFTRKKLVQAYGGVCYCCKSTRLDILLLEHTTPAGLKNRLEAGDHYYPKLSQLWEKKKRVNTLRVACLECALPLNVGQGTCQRHKLRSTS